MEDAVLVTGAGGFVGSAVVRGLVGGERPVFWDGNPVGKVVALLRPGGSTERLEELRPSAAWSLEHADLADGEALSALMRRERPRAVLHLALDRAAFQRVLPPQADPLVTGPLEGLFEGLARTPDSRFVHTGSHWVLGSGERLAEDAPLDVRSPYARNKARADALLPPLGERTGVPWINLRLFNAFGRYEPASRLLPHLVTRLSRGETALLSQGDQLRDFTDVDVIAQAYGLALKAPQEACGAVYHIGSGRGSTVRAFADMVAEVVGNRDRIRFGGADTEDQLLASLVADPALAERRLGWVPDVDLRARIHAAARWWLDRLGGVGERPVELQRLAPHTGRAEPMSAPHVSVVVPCRDCAGLVGYQLEALAAQVSDGRCEVVAVDDGSTDDTRDVLGGWERRLEPLRVLSLNGSGRSASAARNAGLRAARGERVLFCDADDVVQAGWVAALTAALEYFDIVGGPLAFGALNPDWPGMSTRKLDEALALSCDHLPFAHTGNLGVRRSAAVALGGFDESMVTAEDQDFSWRAIRAGLSVGFARDAVVNVRLPRRLRALWRQRVNWGMGSVDLYVRHRAHMPPPRRLRGALRGLVPLARIAVAATVSRRARLYFIESLGIIVGRTRGSLKNRTFYL